MKEFWHDGYDYVVDVAKLEAAGGVCYIYETARGWMRLKLEKKREGLRRQHAEAVEERPADCVVARHSGAVSAQLRAQEGTLTTFDATGIDP